MNCLPESIEIIIVDYKSQMEHKEKFIHCIEEINAIRHTIDVDGKESRILYPDDTLVTYIFHKGNQRYNQRLTVINKLNEYVPEEDEWYVVHYFTKILKTNAVLCDCGECENVTHLIIDRTEYTKHSDYY